MNNQTESPFNNPRFIISIVVVFLFLWGWQFYVNKTYPPQVKPAVVTQGSADLTTAQSSTNNIDSSMSKTGSQDATVVQASATVEEKTFNYEDDKIKWQLSSNGMGLNFVELKKYTDHDKKQIIFQPETKIFSLVVDNQVVNFELNQVGATEFVGLGQLNGKNIKRTITFMPETSSFSSVVEFEEKPTTVAFITTEPKHVIKGGNFLMPSFEKQDFLFKANEKVSTHYIAGLKDGERFEATENATVLSGISSQYFTQSYIDKSDLLPSSLMLVSQNTARLSINYNLINANIKEIKSLIYVGPKEVGVLNKIDPVMPEVMNYGMFGFISKPLLSLMIFLFGIFGNWGVAIIGLTLVMRLIMLPFNIVSFKSARAMQKIQPQLAAVREKYKSDPLKVNKETMALMKEHKANPLSSCLPMLIQIPVFFALWQTIGSSIEIYQQPFMLWITDLSAHDPFFILPILMGVTMYFQQKLTPTTMDPMQAKILNFMPILFSVFMLSLPSGLTLYNFISSLFGAVQQYFLLKDKTT